MPLLVNSKFLSQHPITGVTRYAIEIAEQLSSIDPQVNFIANNDIKHHETAQLLNPNQVGRSEGITWEQVELPYFIRKKFKNDHLLLNLENLAPLLTRNIVVIHDIIWKTHNFHTKKNLAYYRSIMPLIIKRAQHIITVSEYSKNQILQHFKINDKKISVAGCAVPSILQKINLDAIHEDNSKKRPYILGPLNKNPLVLIKAFEKIKCSDEYDLILIGAKRIDINSELNQYLQKNKRIKLTGHITDKELAKLYSQATVFVYPSVIDGFGIPPIEAMHFGCPVICSNSASLPEVVGNAAFSFDPSNEMELTNYLNKVLDSEDLRNKLIQKGNYQKDQFSWEKSAKTIYNVMQSFQ
ncbi:glycosyltransferase family 4 protein [Reichenbachiella carrageenanivorans]|uniref:Glycosyltransferase family 4 protein n=1 Tax=Reichenbachiella carrageenanivorans TaxID=2979869 RepID=A0ABY6D638_9BACT|nr:glycosyltransferase family 1 protein [Reichenbachiella carrageenanivorans]UXX80598.1 glycosyltransferase family 4 protein [Reichenbachiella carrageenanivorans]